LGEVASCKESRHIGGCLAHLFRYLWLRVVGYALAPLMWSGPGKIFSGRVSGVRASINISSYLSGSGIQVSQVVSKAGYIVAWLKVAV